MRRPSVIAVLATLVLLTGVGVGVVVLDSRADGRIAKGVSVGGVDVGGITPEGARARLQRELVAPLGAPIAVHHGRRSFRLTADGAKIAADVDGMVDAAMDRSESGNILARAGRELTGGSVDADLPARITHSRRAVSLLVDRVQNGIDRKPRDAKVSFTAAGLSRVAGRSGLAVEAKSLENRINDAISQPGADRSFSASTRKVRPKVSSSQLARRYPVALTVDRKNFRIRLFKKLKLVKTYPVALGQAGLETPAGLYNIANKAINPAWSVPNSAWAGSLAGQVIPGGAANNPLKARWLGIYGGVGVHGTSDRASIGTNASHGCIRMLVEDVTELYDRVPVKAPIYIA